MKLRRVFYYFYPKGKVSSFIFILFACNAFISPIETQGQILEYSTHIEVVYGEKTTTISKKIQINNKESNWLADISIPVDGNQRFDFVSAEIKDLNGTTKRKLKKKELVSHNDIRRGSFYEDDLYYEFSLKWNSYPYVISYSYRIIDEEFLFVARWIPSIYEDIPVKKASLVVELPINYMVIMDTTPGFNFSSLSLENTIIYEWKKENCTLHESELYSPPRFETTSKVLVIPQSFLYEYEGSTKSWSEYGDWVNKLNDGGYNLPVNEKSMVDKLIKNITDTNEIVRTLYHYLQDNTRYINVAIDKGGLKPYPAEYVSLNKYGDCKALTYYLKSMLKYVGIESFYTLVYGGDNYQKVNIDKPSQQFNHVILSIPINGDTIWLENTSNYLPYNYLGTFTQNRYALLIDGKESKLVCTPSMELDDVKEVANYNMELNDDGVGLGTINLTLKGSNFEKANYYFNEAPEVMKKELVEDQVKLHDYELIEWEYDQNNRDTSTLEIIVQVDVKNQYREIGDLKVIKPVMTTLPDFEKPRDRKLSVRIPYPINRNYTTTYNIISIIDYLIEIPDNVVIESEYGYYSEDYTMDGNTIKVVNNYKLYAAEIPLNIYNDFYAFIKNIEVSQKRSAIILNTQ